MMTSTASTVDASRQTQWRIDGVCRCDCTQRLATKLLDCFNVELSRLGPPLEDELISHRSARENFIASVSVEKLRSLACSFMDILQVQREMVCSVINKMEEPHHHRCTVNCSCSEAGSGRCCADKTLTPAPPPPTEVAVANPRHRESLAPLILSDRGSICSLQDDRPVKQLTGTIETTTGGATVICDYEILGEIGRGSSATVILAAGRRSDELYAIKTMAMKTVRRNSDSIPRSPLLRDRPVEYEIALMKKLRHKNLVRLHAVVEDAEEQQCHLIMQYIENGPIAKLDCTGTCQPQPVVNSLRYMREAASGLEYLHRHGVLHRDVKPENILIGADDVAYVADFGVSSFIADVEKETTWDSDGDTPLGTFSEARNHRTTAGTLPFLAPEVLAEEGEVAMLQHGTAADTWALGVTLYVLIYGRLPFNGPHPRAVINSIQNDDLKFPELPVVPLGVRTLIERLLERDPSTRMVLSQFRAQVKTLLRNLDCQSTLPEVANSESDSPTERESCPPTSGLVGTPSSDESPFEELDHAKGSNEEAVKPRPPISITEEEAKSSVARRRLSFGLVGYSSPLTCTRSGFQSRRGTVEYSLASPTNVPSDWTLTRSPRPALSEFVFPPICPPAPNSPKGLPWEAMERLMAFALPTLLETHTKNLPSQTANRRQDVPPLLSPPSLGSVSLEVSAIHLESIYFLRHDTQLVISWRALCRRGKRFAIDTIKRRSQNIAVRSSSSSVKCYANEPARPPLRLEALSCAANIALLPRAKLYERSMSFSPLSVIRCPKCVYTLMRGFGASGEISLERLLFYSLR